MQEFAKKIGSAYIETSSKDNVNVHQAFEYIASAEPPPSPPADHFIPY